MVKHEVVEAVKRYTLENKKCVIIHAENTKNIETQKGRNTFAYHIMADCSLGKN